MPCPTPIDRVQQPGSATTHANPAPAAPTRNQAANQQLPWVGKENSPELRALTSNAAALEPYLTDLRSSVVKIKEFILANAKATGTQKKRALEKLELYAVQRINCPPADHKAVTLNQHRRLLRAFADLLAEPQPGAGDAHVKNALACALELTEGLGVCADGELLNMYEQYAILSSNGESFEKRLGNARNTLINQNLLTLVRSEASDLMNVEQAKALEIHQVQTLRNTLASKWGLETIEDKHAHPLYAKQAAKMADALLEHTVTPVAQARLLAEELRNFASSIVGETKAGDQVYDLISTGVPHGLLTAAVTDPLLQMLKTEFGLKDGALDEVLHSETVTLSDGSTEVRYKLNSTDDIAKVLLNEHRDRFGLADTTKVDELVEKTKAPNIDDLVKKLKSKRDKTAAATLWGGHINTTPYVHHFTGVLLGDQHDKEEAEERKRAAQHSGAKSATHAVPHELRDDISEVDPEETHRSDLN